MVPMSKGWLLTAAFGYGVIAAMAIRGGLNTVGWLSDFDVSDRTAGNIWLITCLTLGPLFVWLQARALKMAEERERASAE